MNYLYAQDLAQFSRKYRFAGSKLRRVHIRPRGNAVSVEVTLAVRSAVQNLGESGKRIRLVLHIDGAEEFRFQKRPITNPAKVSDVKFGYFNGLFFINFDAWGLQPGEVPAVHDFRASDAFVAGKSVSWEEVTKPT